MCGSERTSYRISTSANYDLSDQCVPAMVAQWAVEPGERDAHFFFTGDSSVGRTQEEDSTEEE